MPILISTLRVWVFTKVKPSIHPYKVNGFKGTVLISPAFLLAAFNALETPNGHILAVPFRLVLGLSPSVLDCPGFCGLGKEWDIISKLL